MSTRRAAATLGAVCAAMLDLADRATDHVAFACASDPSLLLTRGELLRRAAGIARAVHERTDAAAAPVLIALENGPTLAAAFAASILGDFPVALMPSSISEAELASAARRLGATLLLSDRTIQSPADLLTLDPSGIEPAPVVAPSRKARRWAVVLHTSGTTALPKLVLREAPALDAVAVNTAHAIALTERDCVLAAIPMAHSYGLEHTLLAPLLTGATVVTMAGFDPGRAAALLASSVTVFPGVPVMFEALALPAHAVVRASARPRLAYSAGSPLPAATRARFEHAWSLSIGNLYGSSDVGSVTFNDPADPDFDPEFAGAPMPGVSIRILSEPSPDGIPLPPGEPGHVAIRAGSMLTRYIDGPADGLPLADGHLLTGDLGLLDPRRGLRITGREALLLDIDGRKVNPAEVEEALAEHPGVAASVVLPLAITPTINRLRAVIEPRNPAEPPAASELRTLLRAKLAPYKVPRLFEFVDRLPRSQSGKVQRVVSAHAGSHS